MSGLGAGARGPRVPDNMCDHKRKIVESPWEAKQRWESGESDQWFQAKCASCGDLFFVPSDKQVESRIESKMEEYQHAGNEQMVASRRNPNRAKRLRLSRRRREAD